ncbi:MAG: pyrimidine reductase family protein [Acidimicrobiia bacterium]|nr:pyrimidine reductase family protein [Acidimicrobiia bacterium]
MPTWLDPVEPAAVYGDLPAHDDRPGVRLNVVTSLDGANSVGGRSRGLGGPADRRLFLLLRTLADVVLVGAGTVRTERYRPVEVGPAEQDARRQRDQAPVPPIAVVSRSCALDWTSPFFTHAVARPVVLTVAGAPAAQRARAAEVADVVLAGDTDVHLATALDALGARGARSVLAEGGPELNRQLVRAGLLDELCLTLAPRLVGGDATRILGGPELEGGDDLRLRSLCEEDGFLFLRYGTTGRVVD